MNVHDAHNDKMKYILENTVPLMIRPDVWLHEHRGTYVLYLHGDNPIMTDDYGEILEFLITNGYETP